MVEIPGGLSFVFLRGVGFWGMSKVVHFCDIRTVLWVLFLFLGILTMPWNSFIPSFLIFWIFTAPSGSFLTVIFAFPVFYGTIELFSYRHFCYSGFSWHH
jgi:hypothetical protein